VVLARLVELTQQPLVGKGHNMVLGISGVPRVVIQGIARSNGVAKRRRSHQYQRQEQGQSHHN
jgi:hypothetical protein